MSHLFLKKKSVLQHLNQKHKGSRWKTDVHPGGCSKQFFFKSDVCVSVCTVSKHRLELTVYIYLNAHLFDMRMLIR